MPQNKDLHGNAPDKSNVVLLLIDIISDFEFEDGEKLFKHALPNFVLKPKHSGFYSTTLDILLEHLQCRTLILTGVTTNSCILFTANDAYIRDFNLVIPRDCVAAVDVRENAHALKHLKRVLKADISPSSKIDFDELKKI